MQIPYKPLLPHTTQPIIIVGASGIARDAHLPAYQQALFPVLGIVDPQASRAEALAAQFNIPQVYTATTDAVAGAPANAVYDIATVPEHYPAILKELPDGCAVLLQKPMGEDLAQATEILEICRRKNLVAAVNFQLRFAPFVSAARHLVDNGFLGELYDLEVRVTVNTPWELFPQVMVHPRLEMLYHSIHYIDLLRSFLGNPAGIMAKTYRHPAKTLSSTRSTIVLDYGDTMRAVINTNHDHAFGARHQESFIKWEGTRGAIKVKMGLLMDYPRGVPDSFEYCLFEDGVEPAWKEYGLEGSWFPEAFVGTMASLMRYKEGSSASLPTSVEDVVHTMVVVESAYESNDRGGVRVADPLNQYSL